MPRAKTLPLPVLANSFLEPLWHTPASLVLEKLQAGGSWEQGQYRSVRFASTIQERKERKGMVEEWEMREKRRKKRKREGGRGGRKRESDREEAEGGEEEEKKGKRIQKEGRKERREGGEGWRRKERERGGWREKKEG